ncbi:unnamed protein product, partial [marine sediment metagenome]
MHDQIDDYISFAAEVRSEGIRYVVLLGMGGSSLAPQVFQDVFGAESGFPTLTMLDSTHPSAIRDVEDTINIQRTLFVVSSKSGTTIETLSLFNFFWNRVSQVSTRPGHQFVTITDPGTPLETLARNRGFRHIFHAPPDVGGRYSALTAFGLVPASLIGMNVHGFLDRAWIMTENCAFCVSSHIALGIVLGAVLGEITMQGRDKITFLTSSSIKSFPIWLEQLLAESTGKQGKGIIPIVNEPIPEDLTRYAADRCFIALMLQTDDNEILEEQLKSITRQGNPTVQIMLPEKINLSQEIYSWEIAVAAAGAVLGIHPFNQPDVQMAKDLAKKMMAHAEQGIFPEKNLETYSVLDAASLEQGIRKWLQSARSGDYVAIQAYIAPAREVTEAIQEIRSEFLNRLRLATTFGYGPRFLHSTGQLHKGGPG